MLIDLDRSIGCLGNYLKHDRAARTMSYFDEVLSNNLSPFSRVVRTNSF